jgi:hydroxymethylbilane synthase
VRVHALDHAPTSIAVRAERSLLRTLEGGCQIPIGALTVAGGSPDEIRLHGLVADPEGGTVVRGTMAGSLADPEALGARLAEDLLSQGADAILARLRAATPRTSPPIALP